jgi:hypothetical protein
MSGVQLVEQRPGFLQVEDFESFGLPTLDRSEKIVGLISFSSPGTCAPEQGAFFIGQCSEFT